MPTALRRVALVAAASLGLAAAAAAVEVDGRVVSVRGDRTYVELGEPLRVEAGAEVALNTGDGSVVTIVVSVASRWLVVEGDLGLQKGDRVVLAVDRVAPAPTSSAGGGGGGDGPRAGVRIGRRGPSRSDYDAGADPPPQERRPHRRGREREDVELPKVDGPGVDGGEATDGGDDDDRGLLPANEVRGEVEVGAQAAHDHSTDNERVTPFARLRLEVRRLGGSDRTRLMFYGSVRQDFGLANPDWTDHNERQVDARISAAFLEVEARPEALVDGFADRLELAVGRSAVPGVTAASIIDGGRVGLRIGPAVVFGFGGMGASLNPQREDYDSYVYGGGIRFAKSFTHSGAIRLSIAGGQERFRGEGERDFLEAQMDIRYGAFGTRGFLIVDFFDQLRDKRKTRLTLGQLTVYAQLTADVRVLAGFRETRPQYSADLLGPDRLQRANGGSELQPIIQGGAVVGNQVAPFLERDERRNVWLDLAFRFGEGWQLVLGGEYYTAPESRDAYGGSVRLSKVGLVADGDRFSLDLSARQRHRGPFSFHEDSLDPVAVLTYGVLGETVDWSVSAFYRTSIPASGGDTRVGGRGSLSVELTDDLFLRVWGSAQVRRNVTNEGELYTGGLSLRLWF